MAVRRPKPQNHEDVYRVRKLHGLARPGEEWLELISLSLFLKIGCIEAGE